MRPERSTADQVGEHLRLIGSYEPAVSIAHFEQLHGNTALDDYLRDYAELSVDRRRAKVFDDEHRITYNQRKACCYDPNTGVVVTVWISSECRSLDPQSYYVRIFNIGQTTSKRSLVQEVRPERDNKPITLLYLDQTKADPRFLGPEVDYIKLTVDSADIWMGWNDKSEILLRPVTELIGKRNKLNTQLQELGPIALGDSLLIDTID